MIKTKALGWAAALLLAATVLACGGSPGSGTGENATGGPVPATGAGETASPAGGGPVVAELGSRGLVFKAEKIDVAISKPGPYKPGQYMPRVPQGQVAFVVTVALTNHTDQAIKPSGLYFTASVGGDAAEAEQVFDSAAGLKGTPDTALLPGKTTKFKIGFQAPAVEKNPEININVTAFELGGTTGLFRGKLRG